MSLQADSERARALWYATDRRLERASVPGILAHRLGPLAANRSRRLGEVVAEPLALEERAASLSMLTAFPLLERVRTSCDGPLVLIKGPEVARLYPGSARRFSDLDLLTDNAAGVQLALRACGFLEMPDPHFDHGPEHHHLEPLKWPTIWLKVEVHSSPNWPERVTPPRFDEILEGSSPSTLGVDGFQVAAPHHHALILASHAWRHEALQTLRDLVDVAATAASADEAELERTAEAWGIGRLWGTTRRAIEAIFYDGSRSVPLRSWARHLEPMRERTVLERHAERLLHGYWGLPPHQAAAQSMRAVKYLVEPAPGESWGIKLRRARRALRRPGAPVTGRDPRRPGTGTRRDPPSV